MPPSATQLGVRTTEQLMHGGYTAGRIERLVRGGVLLRIWRGHYVAASTWSKLSPSHQQAARLACAQGNSIAGGRVLCRQSAALAHGVSLLHVDEAVHVQCPTTRSNEVRHPGLHFHVADDGPDAVLLANGLRATSMTRTFVDCARHLPHRESLVIADQMAATGIDLAPVRSWAAGHAGWRGVARLRLVLEFVDPLAESPGETLTRIRLIEWEVPPPVSQYRVMTPRGLFRADFAWPDRKLILEFDGRVKYFGDVPTGEVLFQERHRENALRELGWTVLRTHWAEITRHPESLRARLAGALATGMRSA